MIVPKAKMVTMGVDRLLLFRFLKEGTNVTWRLIDRNDYIYLLCEEQDDSKILLSELLTNLLQEKAIKSSSG